MEITEAAKTRVQRILEDKGTAYLRVYLEGGGCSGFKYGFDIDDRQPDDVLISDLVVIDPMSYVYLEESELDFVKELMGESFVIHNPNTQTTCGCGSSVGF